MKRKIVFMKNYHPNFLMILSNRHFDLLYVYKTSFGTPSHLACEFATTGRYWRIAVKLMKLLGAKADPIHEYDGITAYYYTKRIHIYV